MAEPREHCAKWNEPNTGKKLYNFIYTEKIKCGYEQDYMDQKIKGECY